MSESPSGKGDAARPEHTPGIYREMFAGIDWVNKPIPQPRLTATEVLELRRTNFNEAKIGAATKQANEAWLSKMHSIFDGVEFEKELHEMKWKMKSK